MTAPKSGGGAWHPRISAGDIAQMLTPTLPQDRAAEAVAGAVKALGLSGPLFERGEVEAVLDHLSKVQGLPGVAARSAQRQSAKTEETAPPSSVHAKDSEKASMRGELVGLLSGALGAQKAEEAVTSTVKKLGLGRILDIKQAAAILEDLANTPGPIGATARFARARLLLRKKDDKAR